MTIHSPTTNHSKSPEQVASFVQEMQSIYLLDRPRERGVERRQVERMQLTMPVSITALDEDLNEMEFQHHGVTRDISTSGVGLVTTNPIRPDFVRLTFEPYHGQSFSVMAKVIYCNDVGYYYQIGCQFLTTDPASDDPRSN